jgi:hypothetical protein
MGEFPRAKVEFLRPREAGPRKAGLAGKERGGLGFEAAEIKGEGAKRLGRYLFRRERGLE